MDLKQAREGSTFKFVFSDGLPTKEELAILLRTEEGSELGSEHESAATRHEEGAAEGSNTAHQNREEPESQSISDGQEDDNLVKELDFSDDDGEALLVLLQIAHLQFRRIPSNLDFPVLH
jgi:hypothetical protein